MKTMFLICFLIMSGIAIYQTYRNTKLEEKMQKYELVYKLQNKELQKYRNRYNK